MTVFAYCPLDRLEDVKLTYESRGWRLTDAESFWHREDDIKLYFTRN